MTVGPTALTEIQQYESLFWAFNAVQLLAITGVAPNTPQNAAAFSANTELLDGQTLVTSNFINSVVASFTPHTFFYGCVVATEETAAGVAQSCTITATGFAPGGAQVASQDFVFAAGPATTLVQPMVQGTFGPAFANVQTVRFALTSALSDVLVAGLIDTVTATLYEAPGAFV